jgi:hypothetical protein
MQFIHAQAGYAFVKVLLSSKRSQSQAGPVRVFRGLLYLL